MTQITAVNSTDQAAQLTIVRGGEGQTQALSGRVAVSPDGVAVVPPVKAYAVSASAQIDDFTYTTGTLHLPDAAWRLTARLARDGEVFDFQLESEPGEVPDLMTLVDTLDVPAVFTIDGLAGQASGPAILSSQLVVQPRERLEVGAADTYAFYAVVDGVVTNTVEADPRPGQDVTVQIVNQQADGGLAGYALVLVAPAED